MERTLNFSEPFLSAEHITYAENFKIQQKSILINIDLDPLIVDDLEIAPFKSAVCANTTIQKVHNMIVMNIAGDDFIGPNSGVDRDIITNTWQHVYNIYSVPHLQNTMLWRSEKEHIGNLELNLWYAPAGTDCGIHNKHDFLEIHTQLYGIGRLQKFHVQHNNSLYQEVFMSPGFTHDPFYNQHGQYPWHQYYADTDCLWMAIEMH